MFKRGSEIFIFIFWLVIGGAILFKYSPIYHDSFLPKNIFNLFPQGWGFFTKSPTGEEFVLYKQIDNTNYERVNLTQSDISNYLGLNKSSRFLDQEILSLDRSIEKTSWVKTKYGLFFNNHNLNSFSSDDKLFESKISIKNEFFYLEQGQYILMKLKPVPFHWSTKNQFKNNPIFICQLSIYD